jgi:hypothetical protein
MGLTAMIVICITAVTLSYSQDYSQEKSATSSEEMTPAKMVKAAEPNVIKEEMMEHKGMMEHKSMMAHTEMRQAEMKHLNDAMESLDMALKAVDSGDTKTAKAELDKARMNLAALKQSMEKSMKMRMANTRCPMTGMTIDPMKVSESQMRMCKGMKVGFCSPDCAVAWDKLSDTEKDAKLQEVLPAANVSCPISGKTIDRMKLPDNQMRMYKGMKIGFCCPACPLVWDKLSDAEKDAKLEKAMPAHERPYQEK